MKIKRIVSVILFLVMMISVVSLTSFAADEIKVLLDGQELMFDVPPQLINDRTMVPMRKIFESMGATVEWDDATQTVTATKGDIIVIMQIDNTTINVSGEDIVLDVPPQLVDSRTLVPARAVAESLKAKVDWEEATNTVVITSEKNPIDDIYQYENPTIDFSGDDGTMSALHRNLRLLFEQKNLPEKLFENSDELKKLIEDNPEKFMEFIDNEVWALSMSNVAIRYMAESDEEYVISSEEDIYKYIKEVADKYSLHAYQNYVVDAVKIADDKYMLLFNMADIDDSLKVSELDKMIISSYVAIVYDKGDEQFSYFLLEKSFDDEYALCSLNKDMEHSNYGFIANDKKAFVENVTLIVNAE